MISVRSWCPLLLPSRRSSPCKLRPPALERPGVGDCGAAALAGVVPNDSGAGAGQSLDCVSPSCESSTPARCPWSGACATVAASVATGERVARTVRVVAGLVAGRLAREGVLCCQGSPALAPVAGSYWPSVAVLRRQEPSYTLGGCSSSSGWCDSCHIAPQHRPPTY